MLTNVQGSRCLRDMLLLAGRAMKSAMEIAVDDRKPQVVCMSAPLAVTVPAMKLTIDALKTAGLRTRVKVLIGGAPVTMQYAREIGADGHSENAGGAIGLVKNLLVGETA
jgi:methanogenic corrinoid protein MtbC1